MHKSVMGSRECTQGQSQCGDTQGEESGRTCAKRQVREVPIRHLQKFTTQLKWVQLLFT